MIKRFVILRRKPEMSVREFRDYWANVHGLLIAKIPGLIKYIQYHVRSERLDHAAEPYRPMLLIPTQSLEYVSVVQHYLQ